MPRSLLSGELQQKEKPGKTCFSVIASGHGVPVADVCPQPLTGACTNVTVGKLCHPKGSSVERRQPGSLLRAGLHVFSKSVTIYGCPSECECACKNGCEQTDSLIQPIVPLGRSKEKVWVCAWSYVRVIWAQQGRSIIHERCTCITGELRTCSHFVLTHVFSYLPSESLFSPYHVLPWHMRLLWPLQDGFRRKSTWRRREHGWIVTQRSGMVCRIHVSFHITAHEDVILSLLWRWLAFHWEAVIALLHTRLRFKWLFL